MRFYEILMTVLMVLIICAGITFGVDVEIARRDYIRNGSAVGCIWQFNCDRYNK